MTPDLNVAHPALSTFLGHLGGVAVSASDPVALIRRTIDPFRHLLMENFLPDGFHGVSASDVTRWVIFQSTDGSLSLIVSMIPSRHKTPVHDHGAQWGLAGIYQGEAREVSYVPDLERAEDGSAITRTTRRRLRPGDVTGILPPDMDIHTTEVTSSVPAIVLMLLASRPDDPHRYVYDVRHRTRSFANDHFGERLGLG